MTWFGSPTISSLENALDGLAWRQNLLAGNIANAGTPGFVARDVDFKSVMTRLSSGQSAPDALALTSPTHLDGRTEPGADMWQGATTYSSAAPDVKQQMVAVSENGVHYAAVAQALTQQLSRYRMAIREGK